jgi:hypothetical protein
VKKILLTKGQFALVDDEDFDWLSRYKWHADWSKTSKSYYACRRKTVGKYDSYIQRMHREILGLERGDKRQGDHRNGDSLDYQRCNLRIATHLQNQYNKKMRNTNRSGYKGVYKIQYVLGCRDTAKAASSLYKKAALRLHGQFARI